MAKKISVILLEYVPDIGRAGQVVEVSEGFARNKLFPAGSAALASTPAGKKAERDESVKRKKKSEILKAAQGLAERLEGTELIIAAKVKEGEGEELFGSVSAKQISEELANQGNFDIAVKQIHIEEPIKSLGAYKVRLQLVPEVDCELQVTVSNEDEKS